MDAVQRPIVPVIGRLIDEHPGTLSLGQGMVSYPPPPEALRVIATIGNDPADHHYGPVEGIPSLVSAIEAKLAAENAVRVRPASRVVVTAGGNMAFVNAVLAVTDPGDEVVLLSPYYFNHDMAVTMIGCRTVAVSTDDRYQVDLARVRSAITPRTRAIVTISPNNPTGAVYPESDLRAVNALCGDRGLYHIHDEVYEYFTFGDVPHFSPGSIEGAAAHTISLYSLSKAYGFAGWRIGYMVVPAGLVESILKIQDTNLICPPMASQRAALAALAAGRRYCATHIGEIARARWFVLERLRAVEDVCAVPGAEGALYCLLRLKGDLSSMTLAERLIREHRVATIPGETFGLEHECALRISYGVLDAPTLSEALDRLVGGLRAILD
jgi:aspartate/methionine/tyrosine aminotransferase